MNYRKQIIQAIAKNFGNQKQLVWVGLRGSDAEPLLEFEQFRHAFSIISPLKLFGVTEECLETISRQRVDLNKYSTEFDTSKSLDLFFQRLLDVCNSPVVIAPYRPMEMITSIYFSREKHIQYLGLFHGLQAMFDYKPWVEHELRQIGVKVIPWTYLTRGDVTSLNVGNSPNPFVLRTSRSSGGIGFSIIREQSDLNRMLEGNRERLFATSPYLSPNIPLNINACVFPSGDISIHGPSLQLIGLTSCIRKELGYCGNDFARIKDVEPVLLDNLEKTTIQIGHWLYKRGYIGAFGVDAIIHEGKIYVSEVNPRFQGSSTQSAILDAQLGNVDVFLAHIAAFLGLDPPKMIHCRELALNQEPIAQVYCFNSSDHWVKYKPESKLIADPLLLPSNNVMVASDAMLFKLVLKGPVTDDGSNLINEYESIIQRITSKSFERASDEK